MKKKVLSMVLALYMSLGLISMLPTPAQAASTKDWKDAYATFLKDPKMLKLPSADYVLNYERDGGNQYVSGFSMYDIDKNGIPELIVNYKTCATINNGMSSIIYTYDSVNNVIVKVLEDNMILYISDNPEISGLFENLPTGHLSCEISNLTMENNKITNTIIYQYASFNKPQETIINKALYDIYQKSKQLPSYFVTDFNISNIITNYGESNIATSTTGWTNNNGTWYYYDANGTMKTGWLNDNGTWYFLNADGSMASNTVIDGYTLGSDGAWIN